MNFFLVSLLFVVLCHVRCGSGDKHLIVQLHNKVRGEVNPPAFNMQRMNWSQTGAHYAKNIANGCRLRHSDTSQRPGCGENMAAVSGHSGNWQTAVKTWMDERKVFTFGRRNVNYKSVAHYTQMVWAESNSVGCASQKCRANSPFGGFAEWELFVCIYCPAGNVNDWSRPYAPQRSG